ncbi:hypothetical protein AU210_016388 [Fusarium oxysporum f. sp. radicis-cucumerinum]|uniref:Uncharacterized protein n=1 Tax=Fusarium oxysporum f. sp. radicis-cucumerinum TaxID=327505 RepID=A0A2H3FP68_FUSOX|nr:hypothetical protein AU210_016388 [Fusarium oxysporum f. sp. radicis-cucumerinum]
MTLPQSEATRLKDIHDATLACISGFEACLSVQPLMEEGWAKNKLAAMKSWASDVGALAEPEVSLDRRLQVKPCIVVSNLLLTLNKSIEICRILAMNGTNGGRLDVMSRYKDTSASPMERPVVIDSESTSSSVSWFMALGRDIGMDLDTSSESDTEDDSADHDYEAKLKTSMDHIDDILNQLIKLGLAIQKSGTAARLPKADETFNPK